MPVCKIEFEHRSGAAPVPSLHVRVTDTGIGIPADRHDQILTVLFSLAMAIARTKARVWPSICQRLVTLMGGEMTLDSTEGQGSSFAFWVPAKAFEPSAVDLQPMVWTLTRQQARQVPPCPRILQ